MEILGIEFSQELMVVAVCFGAYLVSLISIADIRR